MTHSNTEKVLRTREDCWPFGLVTTPIWIFDITKREMWWANDSAVNFWDADSLDSLLARDFKSDMSTATVTRLEDYFEKFKRGESITEQWTFYPSGGTPRTIVSLFSGIKVENGRLAMLCQGELLEEIQDATDLRGVESLRHTKMLVSLFDLENAKPLMRNPESINAYGSSTSFFDQFLNTADVTQARQSIAENAIYDAEVQMHTQQGEQWHSINVRTVKDPVTGKPALLVNEIDITFLVKTQHKLAEVEHANLTKSHFLANMSHELRTPLNGILGISELLTETHLDADQKEYLDNIAYSGNILLSLINDILDFSKIEAGKIILDPVPASIKQNMTATIDALRSLSDKKGINILLTISEAIPELCMFDPTRVQQIVANLISNAIKFSEHGIIQIDVSVSSNNADQPYLSTKVTDQGIGIPEAVQTAIFDRFRQADNTTSRHYGGSGLGLSICRSLVKLMKGSIGVESKPGVGSTFWFKIPLVSASDEDHTTSPIKTDTPQLAIDFSQIKVLLVEDNKINQMVASKMLKKLGCQVHSVDSGLAALEAVGTQMFTLILMDLMMPGMDGLETTRAIRARQNGKAVRIIALTAAVTLDDQKKCRDVGMDDFLSKPISMARLRQALNRIPNTPQRGH